MDELHDTHDASDASETSPAESAPYSSAWDSPFRMDASGWQRACEALGVDPAKPVATGTRAKPRKARAAKSSLSRPPRAVPQDRAGHDLDTAWSVALHELGRLGAHLGDGRFALWCINDLEHSDPDGSSENARGSCVLLPALEDHPHGLPHCSHAHCSRLRVDDWRAIVPAEVWERALAAVADDDAEEPAEGETGGGAGDPPADGSPFAPVPPAHARAYIVISSRAGSRDDNGGSSGAVVYRTPLPDLARLGLEALSVTPWGERIFTLDGSNPPAMVHVLPPGYTEADSSPDSSPRARVVTTSKHVLRGWFSGAARWVTEGAGRSGREVHESDPPEPVVAFALETCEVMRPLRGVVEAPAMRADGSIISTPGYDPATRLYAAFDPDAAREALSRIPERPTQEDAQSALAHLIELVSDFPFESPAHRGCWLAGLVTMFAREVHSGPAPLFFVRANTRGSGKTLLTELPHIIATGERPAMLGWAGDDTEFEKLVTAEAIAGSRCIVIDNITGTMKSACLDRILTSGKHRARILGGNTRFDGPMLAVWWASGNNVETSDDMARRTAPVELVAREERPELRQGFKADQSEEANGETGTAALRAKAKRGRWGYVADVLTILRAWHCAGRPSSGLSSWGSFESWSRVIRGALVFAGCEDPGKAHEDFRDAAASDVGLLRGLLSGWRKAVKARVLAPDGETLARAIKKLLANANNPDEGGNELREALEEICGEDLSRWHDTHKRLAGKFLKANHRKVARTDIGTLMLENVGESSGSTRWRVAEAVSDNSSPPDEGGVRGCRGSRGSVSTHYADAQPCAPAHASVRAPSSNTPPTPPSPPHSPSPPPDEDGQSFDYSEDDPERDAIQHETEESPW